MYVDDINGAGGYKRGIDHSYMSMTTIHVVVIDMYVKHFQLFAFWAHGRIAFGPLAVG